MSLPRFAPVSVLPIFAIVCGLLFMGCEKSPSTAGIQATPDQSTTDSALTKQAELNVETFLSLVSPNPMDVGNAIKKIEKHWEPGVETIVLEAARLSGSKDVVDQAIWLVESKLQQNPGTGIREAIQWLWNQDYESHPLYPEFKSRLYSRIDPSFAEYFETTAKATIRLDEVIWGGVRRDGIPPLKNPEMIAADAASYLNDSDVVFGVTLNGESRCYPKRILAWHEMFKDTIGDIPVCGVY